jgi:DNA-binding Lrp family transcriptional regulator
MTDPTALQLATLRYIQEWYIEYMYPPTVRDLAQMVGVSSKAMYDRVNAMRKKGLLLDEKKIVPVGIKVVKIVDTK